MIWCLRDICSLGLMLFILDLSNRKSLNLIMKRLTLPFVMICLLGLTGCATGTHIITGAKRPALKPEQVTLYQIAPEKFEIIGIVNASTPGKRQSSMDDAVNTLKAEAAKIGANGVLLGSVNPGSEAIGASSGSAFGGGHSAFGSAFAVSSSGIQLTGQAIYVAQ